MSENTLNNLVKPVNFIPFSNREVAKTLEKIFEQDFIGIIKKIKEFLSTTGYIKTDKDCCIGYAAGNYFLFQDNIEEKNPGDVSFKKKIINNFDCVWPTEEQLSTISRKYEASSFIASDNNNCTVFSKINNKWITEDWKIPAFPVGVYNIENCINEKDLISFLMENGINIQNKKHTETFDFISNFGELKSVMKYDGNHFFVDEEQLVKAKLSDELKNYIYADILETMNLPNNPTTKDVKEYLKNSDKIRIGLPEYESTYFEAFDEWFWDFWIDSDKRPTFYKEINEDEEAGKIFSRNPRYDKKLKEDSLIAIDFGTSSTVVVEADLKNNIRRQICVGGVNAYENPTLMYIQNLGNFLASYISKKTRPNTKWADLQVSHAVREYMGNVASENIKAIVSHIKQWAANRDKPLFIKPANRDENPITIEPLETLVHSDFTEGFNPIEIYAYFLGLFLNNRQPHHGIYTKYYLSYPAKYSDDVIDNIMESFKRGIRKSIPETISDDEIIVEKTVTEPEAYATVALQEYGFEPETIDDKVKFAVFDFGGGTSDFAYGYWSGPSSEAIDKDRRIETVGIDGDPLLGGENLLDGLAYEVFADPRNLQELRGKQFFFNYGVKGQENNASAEIRECIRSNYFATNNLSSLIENSQAGDDGKTFNLRSLWENQSEYFINYLNAGDIASSAILVINEIDALLEVVEEEELRKELEKYKKEAQETDSNNKDADFNNKRIKLHIEAFKKRNPDVVNKLKDSNDLIKTPVMLWSQGTVIKSEKLNTLYISKSLAFDYFTSKIKKGIETFFSGMKDSFGNDYKGVINIFLAGNSSKSPIFLMLMREAINQIQYEQEKFGNQIKFELFERFDSENFPKLLRYAGEKIHGWNEIKIDRLIERKARRPETDKPTGKTGVAFGIIEYLTGNIEKVPLRKKYFKYYLGYGKGPANDMVFIPFESLRETNGKPPYPAIDENNGWIEAFKVTPTEEIVYKTLFYTENNICLEGDRYTDEVHAVSKRLKFNKILPGQKIFIKALSEDQIIYIAANDAKEANEITKNMEGSELENITISLN